MSDISRNLHSCIFGSKNTWDDWHMIPIKRPFIVNAELKEKTIDLEGTNGELDYTTALRGYPLYENRKDSLKFRLVDSPEFDSVMKRRNDIASYLHGRYRKLTLEDEPQYYYQGRFELTENKFKGTKDWADITIKYNLEPFKYSILQSTDDWLWDPFSFEDGIIQKSLFYGMETSSDDLKYIENLNGIVGDMAVNPVIKVNVDSGKTIDIWTYSTFTKTWNGKKSYSTSQTDSNSGLVFDVTTTRLAYKGYGTIDITFRTGRL